MLPYVQTPDINDHQIVASLEDQVVITLVKLSEENEKNKGDEENRNLPDIGSWNGSVIAKVYKFTGDSLKKIEKVKVELDCQTKPFVGYLVDNGERYLAVGCPGSNLQIFEIQDDTSGKTQLSTSKCIREPKLSIGKRIKTSSLKIVEDQIETMMMRTLDNSLVFCSQEGSKHKLNWVTPTTTTTDKKFDLPGKPSHVTLQKVNGVIYALCVVNDTLISVDSNGQQKTHKATGKVLLHVAVSTTKIYVLAQTQGTKKLSALAFDFKADGSFGAPAAVNSLNEVLFQDDDVAACKLALLNSGSVPTLAVINKDNKVFKCSGASPKFDLLVDENFFTVIDVCSHPAGEAFVLFKSKETSKMADSRSIFAIAAMKL